MKTFVCFTLAALAFGTAIPASATATCTTCDVWVRHSYITTLPRADPNHIVSLVDQRAAGADPALQATTAMGTSSAAAGVGVVKAASQFTGTVADMPLYLRADNVFASAIFRDQLVFGGNGTDLVDVNVNLPFDYILDSGNPNVRAIVVNVSFTGYFLDFQRQRTQHIIDGTVGAVVVESGIYFAPTFIFNVSANAGGAFNLPISHLFRLHANTPYNMSIYLETVTTDSGSTRLADASHTLNVGAFTGTFTDVTSANYSLPGGGYDLSPVPEPATGALMMAGFGAVGLFARRRRQQMRLPA